MTSRGKFLATIGVLGQITGIDLLQVEIAGEIAGIVTIGAVPIDHLPLRLSHTHDRLAAELCAAGREHQSTHDAERLEGGGMHFG